MAKRQKVMIDVLTDDDVRSNPSMMLLIDEQSEFIRMCGYDDASLVDQYNMAINGQLADKD